MKQKLFMLALMGTLVSHETAVAQATTAPAMWPTNTLGSNSQSEAEAQALANNASTAVSDETTSSNAAAAVTADTYTPAVATMDTNAPAAAPTDTNAPAAAQAALAGEVATANTNTPAVAATDTNAPAAAMTHALAVTQAPVPPVSQVAALNPSAAVATDTNEASIPLIEFQDVLLTVAIENLARQAGINYLLDPKIGYGQPDQSGQIKAEPTLSIRWENVTARQALLALLNNYDLQLVEDPRTQIARITTKDPTAPPPLITRVIQLKYAGASNMVQSVQSTLTDRRSHVFPDVRTSQLVVVATEPEQDAVDILINQLDKPTRQVLIETKLVEVDSTPASAKGINWSGTLANQNISFGNGVLQSASSQSVLTRPGTPTTVTLPSGLTKTTTPSSSTATTLTTVPQPSTSPGGFSLNTLTGLTPAMGFLNADGVQAVLSFLNSSYDAQTLSTPRIVTLDNEPALISVTRQFPVINITASTAGVSSGATSITYSNIGTILQVTPRITANDYIWLTVLPEVSSFFGTDSKVVDGQVYQADIFDDRHIQTQVMIPNGNTLVMGGFIQDNPVASYTEVPILGNIPGLGWAFKSENVSLDKKNLIIFITPTIVHDSDFQPTSTDFLASKPFRMKEPMNPNAAWDKPESDWSNPAPAPNEFTGNPPTPEP